MKKTTKPLILLMTCLSMLLSAYSFAGTGGLTVTVSNSNVTCYGANNGTAVANVSGGVQPYTYLWNNGATTSSISGLGVGTYTVYVNDANNDGAAGTVSTLAGTLTAGYTNGAGTSAKFSSPRAIAIDGNGNLYVADASNNVIRKIVISTGFVTTLAGSGTAGAANGIGTSASFGVIYGLALDGNGNLYVADGGNNMIRKIALSTGTVTTLAGSTTPGNTNGTGTGASFRTPYGLALDASGNLYVAEYSSNNDIRKVNITTGVVTTLAGSGTSGYTDGIGTAAKFNGPCGLTIDGSGNLYVGDYYNYAVRKVVISTGQVTTLAGSTSGSVDGVGTLAKFNSINALTWDGSNNLYLTDWANNEIRKVSTTTATVSTIAGSSKSGHINGAINSATFYGPCGLTIDNNGNLYITEISNNDVRTINPLTGITTSITQPVALTANASATSNVSCYGGNNGSASVTGNGGTTPYTYSWTSGSTTATASNLTAGSYSVTVTDANGCSVTTGVSITQPNSGLTANATPTSNVSCYGGNNGSASVTGNGGTTPYTYSWTSGSTTATASNLTAGSYSVTVTDAHGCSVTTGISITQPSSALTANATVTSNVSCYGGNNGSASVTGNGGTTPYTYSWTSGSTTATASNLAAGSYSVTVTDAHGCSVTTGVSITQPNSGLTANASATSNVSCYGGNNGSASVTGNGGTTPYTYSWTSGSTTATASNLAAGSYSVTVTDANGCSVTTGVSITQPNSGLTANASATSNVSCYGGNNGNAIVYANGGTSPYSYNWTSGSTSVFASNLTAGSYSVTVTDANGCSVTTGVSITQPNSGLTANASATSNVSCYGGNNGNAIVYANGGTTPYTYSWTSGSTTATASNLTAGSYSVTVTDANGCSVTTGVSITQPNSGLTANASATSNVSCYGGNNGNAIVYANGGTSPYSYNWTSGSTSVFASNLTAGSYSVTVTDANGCSVTTGVSITQPNSTLSVTDSIISNILCYGDQNGSISSSVSGGTTPYSFSWSSGSTSATATNLAAGNYSLTVTDAHGCTASLTASINGPSRPLTGSIISITNVSCYGGNNGSVTISENGGTAPYSFSLTSFNPASIAPKFNHSRSNRFTESNLSAGTYTYTITDANNCSTTVTVTITQPQPLAANSSVISNVSCYGGNNGSAIINVNGGTSPYTYNWPLPSTSDSAYSAGLSAGSYNVIIADANGCNSSVNINITQPNDALTANATVSANVLCYGGNNGSITVNSNGGTTPYSYNWSPSVSDSSFANELSAGSYSITVTDANGCLATTGATISQPGSALTASATASNILCYGGNNGSITINSNGGTAPYSYNWSPSVSDSSSANGLSTGNYTVIVTDSNGCSTTAFATINQPGSALIASAIGSNVSCNGGSNGSIAINSNGGVAPYNYSWSPSVSDSSSANGLSAGYYTITVTDANGCSVIVSDTISQPTPLNVSVNSETDASCSTCSDGSASVIATGGSGTYTYLWSSGQNTDSITGLLSGTYTCTVTDACTSYSLAVTIGGGSTSPLSVYGTINNNSCYNNNFTITIHASGGVPPYTYSYYEWDYGYSSGSLSDSVITNPIFGNYNGSDYYIVYVTDATGNEVSNGWYEAVPNNPGNPSICYASVDTTTSHNQIFFNELGLDMTRISGFAIYKDMTTGYQQIGTVASNASSFTDLTSNPNIESSLYEIQAIDTCGGLSPMTPVHQTILLQASMGVGGVVNLSWNNYEGNNVEYYVILRDTGAGFTPYDSVPYGLVAYTDLKPTTNSLAYMVNSVWNGGLSCSPAIGSHSNKKAIIVTGINELNNNSLSSVTVYPNPAKDFVTVTMPLHTEGILSLTDVLGQQIYTEKLSGNETTKQISISNMPQGVYMLKITNGTKETVKRIVKI